jgi:hypothetical protein
MASIAGRSLPGRRRLLLLALAGALVAPWPSALADTGTTGLRMIEMDPPHDCDEFVPESYSLPGVTDGGKKVSLDVYMLLDFKGGSRANFDELKARAKKLLAKAPSSYAPLDIKLNFKRWGLLKRKGNGTTDSQKIINISKRQFGGTRPRGFDVVYTLTEVNMTADGLGNAVAGQADCIGGVRYGKHAFAAGEVSAFEDLRAGPITFYHAATSKIAAHEIGHLMGAHHHYQDCVEGIPTELEEGEPSPCTLMTNFVDFQSLNFSVLEGAVVRGHALDFAAKNDN